MFMEAHHPWQLEELDRRRSGDGDRDVALLRAALPSEVTNGLGGVEDPLAYILRHTQLLPRHLIEILNNVFTAPDPRSVPWAITGEAVRLGVRAAEKIIVSGIFAAHRASYDFAPGALTRLTNRLSICFQASELRKVFNQEGITKITGSDYDDFAEMLIAMGVLGVKVSRTHRYNRAHSDRAEYIAEPPYARRIGIALSGGGVRSAAYNLGALQALQEEQVLATADYLAGVSGGNYIASALTISQAYAEPGTENGRPLWSHGSPEERYLRRSTNYMAPGHVGRTWLAMNTLHGFVLNYVPFLLCASIAGGLVGWLNHWSVILAGFAAEPEYRGAQGHRQVPTAA
jgi:Patatin-like phospholipase